MLWLHGLDLALRPGVEHPWLIKQKHQRHRGWEKWRIIQSILQVRSYSKERLSDMTRVTLGHCIKDKGGNPELPAASAAACLFLSFSVTLEIQITSSYTYWRSLQDLYYTSDDMTIFTICLWSREVSAAYFFTWVSESKRCEVTCSRKSVNLWQSKGLTPALAKSMLVP